MYDGFFQNFSAVQTPKVTNALAGTGVKSVYNRFKCGIFAEKT